MKADQFPEFPTNFASYYNRLHGEALPSASGFTSIYVPMRLRKRSKKPVRLARDVRYVQQRGLCWYCGVYLRMEEVTMDHVVPLASGGTNDLKNLVASCGLCNGDKGTLSLEEFRAVRGGRKFHGER